MTKATLVAFSIAAQVGCSTTLTVTKLKPGDPPPPPRQPGVEGIRYALPVPFLLVCPGPAGTIEVTETYLPDPYNQYAIAAHSSLAKHDLNVSVENGLLTKVEWNPGATDVAAKGVEVAGELAKTAIDKQAEARKQAADKAEEERSKRQAALEAADKAVDAARDELATAQAVLQALEANGGSASAILAARIDVVKAEKKLEAALQARDRLTAQIAAANAAANASLKNDATVPMSEGCVLLRVVDPPVDAKVEPGKNSTKHTLVLAAGQQRFATSSKLKAPPPPTDPPQLRIQGSRVVWPTGTARRLVLRIQSTTPLDELPAGNRDVELYKPDGTKMDSYPVRAALNSAFAATIELSTQTADGQYRLKIPLKPHGLDTRDMHLDIEVRRK